MNILFDQTGAQATFYNGAAEYAQSVFLNMLSMLKNYPDTKIFSLYSSARKFRYEALSPDALKDQEHVTFVDYHNKTVKEIIKENNIQLGFGGEQLPELEIIKLTQEEEDLLCSYYVDE